MKQPRIQPQAYLQILVIVCALLVIFVIPTSGLTDPVGNSPVVGVDATSSESSEFPLLIRPGDRVLFVGDQVTQQMFYTRATAAALLAIMPDAHLRFYNGGRDGATADTTAGWINDLLQLTNPTVVTIALGNNDATQHTIEHFEASMAQLIQQVTGHPSVRQVVILGTLPMPAVGDSGQGPNQHLKALSHASEKVALAHGLIYIDLFDHIQAVFSEARDVGGEPLTFGGQVPNELAHVVISSLVLRGFGVSAEQLDAVQWSPLRPVDMRRIRQVLALRLRPADMESAGRSRAVYQSIQQFDEQFFRQWRLHGPDRPGRLRQAKAAGVEQAWSNVYQLVATEYGRSASAH